MRYILFVPVILLILLSAYFWYSLDNPPKFCTSDFTELWKIKEISKFRSLQGHDYSDSFEHNRSMKHYYCPKGEYGGSNNEIKIFSPVDGRISYIEDEGHILSNGEIQGKQIGIKVDDHFGYEVILFHINPLRNLSVGEKVHSGQWIGYADTRDNSCFDIAIRWGFGPIEKFYSYFQVIDDNVFYEYQKYGIKSRSKMIIPKEVADERAKEPINWKERHESDFVSLNG